MSRLEGVERILVRLQQAGLKVNANKVILLQGSAGIPGVLDLSRRNPAYEEQGDHYHECSGTEDL